MASADERNSIGMELIRIDPGTFIMGKESAALDPDVAVHEHAVNGDYDEHPRHRVTIGSPFYIGATQVTNKQYEEFDANHRYFRGKLGFSFADDEPVVFVSRHDAVAFCEWLSAREDASYRLPTEGEWEYACRAGTDTPYSAGSSLPEAFHRNQTLSWFPDPARSGQVRLIDLTAGRTPPNQWGLYDMHGNVEEWCLDWWAPYDEEAVKDPVGPDDGIFAVTRGGSHSTHPYYLRSSNRSGALPEDRSWLIGFRVVRECPEGPNSVPQAHARQSPPSPDDIPEPGTPPPRKGATGSDTPYFAEPLPYVHIAPGSFGPLYSEHNHEPALVECANGDLFALWFSTFKETGREMVIAQSRLVQGTDAWEPAKVFLDAPDRNMTGLALWKREDGTLYQFGGVSAAATWGNIATYLRTSRDNGYTWSRPRIINPEHTIGQMPIDGVFRAQDGSIVMHCDAVTGGDGGTYLYLSSDEGRTWRNPGGRIAGIHASVAQLRDGRLLALGRGDNVDGRMPRSLSSDMGRTWTVTPSPFDPLTGGQRSTMIRLREGSLLFASFTDGSQFHDETGADFTGTGLFVAISHDEGETWPDRRLVTDEGPGRELNGGAWTRAFTMSRTSAEPKGYLTSYQGADGTIHLISSMIHYRFNLAWATRRQE